MPDRSYPKIKLTTVKGLSQKPQSTKYDYSELQITSNFSLLRGASHPEEYLLQAAKLGYRGLSLTDHHTLSSVVRAWQTARNLELQYIVGCRLDLSCNHPLLPKHCHHLHIALLVYPLNAEGYAALCRLLTLGNSRSLTHDCELTTTDFLPILHHFAITILPPPFLEQEAERSWLCLSDFELLTGLLYEQAVDPTLLSIALSRNYRAISRLDLETLYALGRRLTIPFIATNAVTYHTPRRRLLQDVITCIRRHCTIHEAGTRLASNAESYLKSPAEMSYLFRDQPAAIKRTLEISDRLSEFSLDQLHYEYPAETIPTNRTAIGHLSRLTLTGLRERYPEGTPAKVRNLIHKELQLIKELHYEKYFLTCADIVRFARSRSILCQGRGSAANSAVCYALGITAVDPSRIDLLFARFISKERAEPPDIDIDFEHERREEVIQYIYERYGRNHAALTAEIITYRHRSALRDVGKALGLSTAMAGRIARLAHHWSNYQLASKDLQSIGLNPSDPTITNTITLAKELLGFPRHFSQHVGGFIISAEPLDKLVPVKPATMPGRTTIEWDKDDIETLGLLKVDILALGMLTCIRKTLDLINEPRPGSVYKTPPLELHSIPAEDPAVYQMISKADTIGVFQIESRAQMSMLPRLKPRCFYDLVIEVAIVRPGPIQGDMVHPYLRRRSGNERINFPDSEVRRILGKTLGVPIFQEQAMRLAISLAGFSPGEAEQLRRAMAAWKRNKQAISIFQERIISGMLARGYSLKFAESCMRQLKGFSEYGFPESHAASFALLVYASAWLKKYYPAQFAAGLLNSQPMGFYGPAQIVADLQQHQVSVAPVTVGASRWDCTIERDSANRAILRLGLRLVQGLARHQAELLVKTTQHYGPFKSISDLWCTLKLCHPNMQRTTLIRLAHADAFTGFKIGRRQALWETRSLPTQILPLDRPNTTDSQLALPLLSPLAAMVADYRTTGLSLKAHPLQFLRQALEQNGTMTAATIRAQHHKLIGQRICTAGLILFRQKPPTARGVMFITLEDETGITNLIVRPQILDRYYREIITSSILQAYGRLEGGSEVLYLNVEWLKGGDDLIKESTQTNPQAKTSDSSSATTFCFQNLISSGKIHTTKR